MLNAGDAKGQQKFNVMDVDRGRTRDEANLPPCRRSASSHQLPPVSQWPPQYSAKLYSFESNSRMFQRKPDHSRAVICLLTRKGTSTCSVGSGLKIPFGLLKLRIPSSPSDLRSDQRRLEDGRPQDVRRPWQNDITLPRALQVGSRMYFRRAMSLSRCRLALCTWALLTVVSHVGAFFVVVRSNQWSRPFGYSHRHGTRPGKASTFLCMGMNVNIRIVGRKSSERWLEEGCEMYETRLRPSSVQVETTWHKDNAALIKGVENDETKGHSVVLLDPLGATKTSERFTEDMYEWLDRGGSRLSFVIGGAEGLPPELKFPSKGGTPTMISLSALTFTHQFARMLLMEQIYRATEIRKGSGYHK